MNDIQLSIVTPCYDEQDNIEKLYIELTRVMKTMGITYELIWVENGSSDNTYELMKLHAENDPAIKIVQLSRNFTYQGGVAAGMAFAQGQYLVCIDADLQDPPEIIEQMYQKAISQQFDIVYGIRKQRKESFIQKSSYWLFYRVMRVIADIEIPLDAGDFALINRPVLKALLAMPEKDRFLRGLRAWVGFRSTGIEYNRQAREHGVSKFSIRDQFLIAFQGLFSFSFLPLRFFFYTGLCTCLGLFPLGLVYLLWRLMVPDAWPAGTATIVLLIIFLFGLTLFGIGLIGEYLAIIFVEVKKRPTFIVKTVIKHDEITHKS